MNRPSDPIASVPPTPAAGRAPARDRRGAVSVEYALMAALVVLVAFGALYSGSVGANLRNTFQTLATGI